MEKIKEKITKDIEILAFFKEEIDKVPTFSNEEKLAFINSFASNLFSLKRPMSQSSEEIEDSSKESTGKVYKGGQSKTFAELVRLTKTKQHPDIIMLAVYYLMISKQADSATATDIEQQYSSAMLKLSTNTSAMINLNRKKGYLMEGDKKDGKMGFKITMSGVDYVESMIAGAQ